MHAHIAQAQGQAARLERLRAGGVMLDAPEGTRKGACFAPASMRAHLMFERTAL